jgi:serine/threonine protein kinase/formylglycine-generating enzyme required for sulfatase activity
MPERDPNEPTVVFKDEQGGTAVDGALISLPERIGRYRVERLLGRGGFGLVYLAHDDQLQRLVAIKVPHAQHIVDTTDAETYLLEARTVANLDHPNIVPVHDVGSSEQFPCFVVSKYIDGSDLAARLCESWLSLRETVELVATVAEALHHAHKQGLVHRDVKPGNILIDKHGQAFVVDFGLALREQDFGRAPGYAGTQAYMSPEQARGEGHRVDGRSDIFSLGVVFYELLVGRRPFKADSKQELLEEITSVEARPPRQIDDNIPKELDRICLKALSKRASERYSAARDMAEDLQHYLAAASVEEKSTITRQQRNKTEFDTAVPTPASVLASDCQPIKIVPKGLRSFDKHDADFFLELLPGPRDRDGLPDSIRFWKARIEEFDADNTFSVGLMYGPSGCGKSSLVKAGLLPHLSADVLAVYVESTADETEARLLNGLRKRCPALAANLGLKETLAALRQRQGIPVGKKVLIVLDQFEQWLHAKKLEESTELVTALRHCDGGRMQSIVLVRDDFWMAATRFMRELEVRLVEGQNSAAVDLFPIRHAEKVLAAFGRAFGALPEALSETTNDQKLFLQQAVSGVAQEGKVTSVRLALFADMMKGKPWTLASLKEVGGTEGVGITFLEETFSASTAPPEHRYHQKAARAVLRSLLPDNGTDIKGHIRSQHDLLEASGYASRPKDFDDLLHILDSELRLITPTDPDGVDDGGWSGDAEENNDRARLPTTQPNALWGSARARTTAGEMPHHASPNTDLPPPSNRFYQLTHDYLVLSVRDWLTRKQKETRRGRAEMRLAERSALWQTKPENRHLPSWWEYQNAVWFVPKKNRTPVQQKMLRRARRIHAVRWGSGVTLTLVAGVVVWSFVAVKLDASLRNQVATAVGTMQSSRGLAVPFTLKELQKLPRNLIVAELRSRYESAAEKHKPGLAYALAEYGQVDVELLCSLVKYAAFDEVDNLAAALSHDRNSALTRIEAIAKQVQEREPQPEEEDWRHKARLAVLALHLGDDLLAAEMCRIENRPDPIQRTLFVDEFPNWHGDLEKLVPHCKKISDRALRSAVSMAVGSVPADRPPRSDAEAWKPIIREWFQAAPDNATHSAAGWVLRQWKADLPALANPSQPDASREWFVNSLGMTLLKIGPGQFVRHDGDQDPKDQTVMLTRAFFLCDREVTKAHFQEFMNDPQCPNAEKPADWQPINEGDIADTGDHPQNSASWYDAVLFCNWLSRKEGLEPCYERTGKKERSENMNYDAWQLIVNSTGYRLPTEAEWEYACRAGTTTDFACGSDQELLRKYAVFQSRRTAPVGGKLPNAWGLFDMHGNLWEWCHDWYCAYDAGDVADPTGPSEQPSAEASNRVNRGGRWRSGASSCRSADRGGSPPGDRAGNDGFRVARSSVR